MKGLTINLENTYQSCPLSSPPNSPSKKLITDATNILTFEDVSDFITIQRTNGTCEDVDKALKIVDAKTDLGIVHLHGFINLFILKMSLVFRGKEYDDLLTKQSIYEDYTKSLSEKYKHKAKPILDFLETHLKNTFSSEKKNNLNEKLDQYQIDQFDEDNHDEVSLFNLILNLNSSEITETTFLNEQTQGYVMEAGGKICKNDLLSQEDFIAD